MSLQRLFIIVLLISVTGAFAVERDQRSSLAVAINQDLPRGFDLDFIHDLRFQDGNSTFWKSLSELELSYKVNKYLKIGSGYRYSIYGDKYSERGTFNATFDTKTGRISHKLRVKYQHDVDSDDAPEKYIRTRYSLSHKRIYGFKPFVDVEWFYSLNTEQIEKHRQNLGVDRKLTKVTSLVLYYRLQEEINVNNPEGTGMLGIKFEIEI
ncbi:MAG: DUF2490 domain-containing protein [Candidatus Marinimicrobia bacterium]|nr:DUF2490 domain-containing protein [Candidatus Neomarinimicrobiota bacterium]MCF7850205.1 DUF2490 domain-containing protein [Candidatus Neomarinimicrobiota bacterium]MCF7903753.1 DUF2490 domain-containing protein [Candidatus Neomarinimicrobiota bacterium]